MVWLVALATGCPDRPIAEQVPVQNPVFEKRIPASTDLDILFVIDDSRSTRDQQTLFAENDKHFVDRLEHFPTRPNMHIAVVTTATTARRSTTSGPCCSRRSARASKARYADPGDGSACWWVKRNPSCATATQLELERAAAPAAGTVVEVSCTGEAATLAL